MYYLTWTGSTEVGQVSGLAASTDQEHHYLLAQILSIFPLIHPLGTGFVLGPAPLRVQGGYRIPGIKHRQNYIQKPKKIIYSSVSLVAKNLFPEAFPQISLLLPPNGQDSHIKTNF